MAERIPDIEAGLRVLATDLDVPDVDLGPRVAAAVAAPVSRAVRLRPAVGLAFAVLVAAALVVAVEPAREAVADWLGIGSTRVEVVDSTTEPQGLPPAVGQLGSPADAAEAAARLGRAPLLPATTVGDPDGWLVGDSSATAVWRAGEALPEIDGTGLGLLLTQGPEGAGTLGSVKQAGPDVVVEPAAVKGSFGLWIEGDHLRTTEGGETALAANVLLWVRGGLEFRLESSLDLAGAMSIAESVPASD